MSDLTAWKLIWIDLEKIDGPMSAYVECRPRLLSALDRLIMRLFSSACVYCNLIELNRPISNPCILWEIGIKG